MNPAGLVGCPFVLDGASPQGFDCWGLIEYVRREAFGLPTPIVEPVTHEARDVMIATRATIERGAWCEVHPPGRPGDVVGMARKSRGELHHVGVVIEGGVLHAFSGDRLTGSVILTPFERLGLYFRQLEVYRWPN